MNPELGALLLIRLRIHPRSELAQRTSDEEQDPEAADNERDRVGADNGHCCIERDFARTLWGTCLDR